MIENTIKEKLDKIDGVLKKYNETVYCSVCKHDVKKFLKWCLENCKEFVLPNSYLETISQIDGFDYNGLSFYSLIEENDNNIYETNKIYWENENLRKYLFIGEDSISWYCISMKNNMFYILDKPSGFLISEYTNFDKLLSEALESAL